MTAVADSSTWLSVSLLPGNNSPSNIDSPTSTETWTNVAAWDSAAAAVANVINTTDTWSATEQQEDSATTVAPNPVDTWSVTATEGATDLQVTFPASVDTWSVAANEGVSSISGNSIPIATTDVFNTQWNEGTTSAGTVDWYTELGVDILPRLQAAKLVDLSATNNPVNTTDTWGYSWTESPIDQVQVATFDTLSASGTETSAVIGTFAFQPADSWTLAFNDVSSLNVSGVIAIDTTDTWSVAANDSSIVAVTIAGTVDTWTATATEGSPSDVTVTTDEKNTTDTWSAALTFESGSQSTVSAIPIITGDEWDITQLEISGLAITGAFAITAADQWAAGIIDDGFMSEVVIQVQPRRRIKVDGTIRNVEVE